MKKESIIVKIFTNKDAKRYSMTGHKRYLVCQSGGKYLRDYNMIQAATRYAETMVLNLPGLFKQKVIIK